MSTEELKIKVERRKRRWPRTLLIACGAIILVLVVAWFVLTSAAFFKGVILPQVGKEMHVTITAGDASIRPFKEVVVRNLKVQPDGTEPVLLEVREVRLRYDLLAMLGGDVMVQEIYIDSPVVTVVEKPDGSSNLDPLRQAPTEPEPAKPKVSEGKTSQVVLGAFNLTNAALRYIRNHEDGTRDQIEITGLNIALNDVRNGQSGSLKFGLAVAADMNPSDTAQRGSLKAVHDGSYRFTLGPDLFPTEIQGSDRLTVTEARGALKELAEFRADASAEVTATEIRQALLNLKKGDTDLGALRISGPFDAAKREGRLTILLSGIDRRALNLAGAFFGIDFGTTRIDSSNVVEVVEGGKRLNLNGQLAVARMQLTRSNQITPVLDFGAAYNLAVNNEEQSATLAALALNGAQNGQPILRSELASPMQIAWGGETAAVGDSTLTVNLTRLQLADWRAFAGDTASGELSATLRLLSQRAGKLLSFDLNAKLTGLDAGSPQLGKLDVGFEGRGKVAEFERYDLAEFRLDAAEAAGPLFSVAGSAACDLAQSNVSARVTLALPPTAHAATNAADLTVKVDMSDPQSFRGSTTLLVSTLDLTRLADRFMEGDTAGTAPSVEGSTPAAEQEPEPMVLPLKDYRISAEIGLIRLREIEVADLKATATLDGGKVGIEPFAFALNGAPVRGAANLDLGVRGWKYEVSLGATNLPIAPFAESFVPEYRGAARGDLQASMELQGAGITTPSLIENLSGKTSLGLTHASVQLSAQPKTATGRTLRLVLLVVGKALRLPELMESPIASFGTAAAVGGGQVNIRDLNLASQSFRLQTRGNVSLSPVLTNSTLSGFPVELALSRSLAAQAGLGGANDLDTNYVNLGQLATVTGTLGDPKTKLDMVRIGLLTAQGVANIEGVKGTGAGAIIEGLGGLLGGGSRTNQTATTNSPDTSRKEAVDSLMRGIGGLLGGGRGASTNRPADTNQPPK